MKLCRIFLYILLLGLYVFSIFARPDEEFFGRMQRNNDERYFNRDPDADDRPNDMESYRRGEGCLSHNLINSGNNRNMCGPHKALNIAIKAAQEAKCASDSQMCAAAGAAREVKCQLADKAMTAARAAEAALLGKQEIVSQLEQEVREAEAIVQEESASLQRSQFNAEAACLASQQAQLQYKTLTTSVQLAQDNVNNAEIAANGAAQELSEKSSLAEAAKHRVEILLRQLNSARNDFASTRKAVYRAACAAQTAKQKANS